MPGSAPVSATVTRARDGRASSRRRSVGRSLDKVALLRLLSDDVDVVDAPFTAERPAILDPAARSAASTAKLLLAAPVAIEYRGARLGALTPVSALACAADQDADGIGSPSGSTPSGSRRPFARGSASGSSARTTRSSSVAGDRVHVVPSRPGRDVDPTQGRRRRHEGCARRSRRTHRARRARRRTVDGEGEGARHPPEARLVHDADGRVVVEPDPQRASDGRLHRRHADRARRDVLVQRRRRRSARPSAGSWRGR